MSLQAAPVVTYNQRAGAGAGPHTRLHDWCGRPDVSHIGLAVHTGDSGSCTIQHRRWPAKSVLQWSHSSWCCKTVQLRPPQTIRWHQPSRQCPRWWRPRQRSRRRCLSPLGRCWSRPSRPSRHTLPLHSTEGRRHCHVHEKSRHKWWPGQWHSLNRRKNSLQRTIDRVHHSTVKHQRSQNALFHTQNSFLTGSTGRCYWPQTVSTKACICHDSEQGPRQNLFSWTTTVNKRRLCSWPIVCRSYTIWSSIRRRCSRLSWTAYRWTGCRAQRGVIISSTDQNQTKTTISHSVHTTGKKNRQDIATQEL